MNRTARRWLWAVLLGLAAGCDRAPAPPVDTGARDAAHDFYEGLMQQDWRRAYAVLHPDSTRRLSQQEFTRLAQAHRRGLGFVPEGLRMQSCQENGDEAVARVVLTGRVGAKERRYKDAAALRRTADGWRVVLPDRFGRTAR
jgi:hypothetical protein